MPDMATVCQETAGTPPGMFGARGPQAVGPPHNYYNHCGYSTPTSHSQYGPDGYGPFQASPPDQSPHLQHHVHHQQQPPHPQQAWGYSMGMMGNGRPGHGAISEDWPGQGYLVPNSSTPAQNPYNYAYRGPNSHGPLDYASPMQGGADGDPQGLEGSPSPHTPSPGEPNGTGMGPNNQGAKSLRPPYEWMKPSAALPQAGHVTLFPGKTRTKDKYRVVYSDHQRLELEKEFHFSKYITIRRKAEIAAQLGLSERQVKIWFQNRRAKERKQNKKREEQVHIQHSNSMGSSIGSSQDQQHQQQQQLPPPHGHDHHPHPFIPKMEMDEEKPNLHEISIHSTTMTPQGVGLTSAQTTPTPMGLHPNLHASPIMTVAPSVMSRTMVRYHESVNVQRPSVSPTSNADDVAYRVAATADSSSNSMNLSGSSDSGVVSSH